MKPNVDDVLVLVDVQPDFMPGGALAVAEGDQIVPVINKILPQFEDRVVCTQDWHPEGHGSFASAHGAELFSMGELDGGPQVMWPDHCVQDTDGADLHKDLNLPENVAVIQKGLDPTVDSYSGFYDNNGKNPSPLADVLKDIFGAKRLFVCGLATDYCVKFTVLDAIKEGFEVVLVTDACRGVNQNEGDVDQAVYAMIDAGATVVTSDELL